MTLLDRIKEVATKTEIYTIQIAFRGVIDEYNNQSLKNYIPITQMFEQMERDVMYKIQSETHRKFGADGMVLFSQILPALNLKTNHYILD